MSMLHAQGRSIVNTNGQVVPLVGVNLGGWFVMEKWMAPLDSGSLSDTYSVMQKLDSRFGIETEQSLIKTYQQNWITTTDLDNIKNAGFNVVRAPIWWGQFYLLNDQTPSGWRADAFDMLDWLVSAAAARGIYVIIDMHGVSAARVRPTIPAAQVRTSIGPTATFREIPPTCGGRLPITSKAIPRSPATT